MKRYAILAAFAAMLLFVGYQSCRVHRAEKLAARYEVEKSQAISEFSARLAYADRKHAEAIAAKQAEIDAAHGVSVDLVAKMDAIRARSSKDIAAIKASAGTWEQKFGELEIKYEADMLTASATIDALTKENGLLVDQVRNYKSAAEDYRRMNDEALAKMRQLVADNLGIAAKYRKARTWATATTAGVAILAAVLVAKR